MAAVALTPEDLVPFAAIETAKAQAMIDDAMAIAALDAPCIVSVDFDAGKAAAAKALIRRAILRWNDTGSGALVQKQRTDGPFTRSETVDQRRTEIFTEDEIDRLKRLCSGETKSAFSIDTAPGLTTTHADVCSLNFGADYCSCGASLAGFPLWE